MSKKLQSLLLTIIMLAVLVPTTLAAPPAQEEGQDYIVVADDWLSKLADKYLGNSLAYPTIVYYTNQKNAEDASYANITDANLIEVGWKIYIPSAAEAQAYLAPAAAEAAEAVLPDIGTLQVGYMPVLGMANFFVAVEKGYFEEQGLDVELQSFRSGALMVAPLSAGHLDVGQGEIGVPLYNAINQGLPIRVVAGGSSQPPGYGYTPFLVRKELFDSGEITDPADLRGRTMAVNMERGFSEYLLSEVLARADLTVDDVNLIVLPVPEVPAAFANKAIDAGACPYPAAAQIIVEEWGVVLLEGDEIADNPQNGGIYFGQRLLDPANREVGVRFLVAILKAHRDLVGDGWRADENMAIISKYTNLPVSVIQATPPIYTDPNGELYRASFERVQAYHFGRGYTDLTEPLAFEQVFDETFLEEARARIGRFQE